MDTAQFLTELRAQRDRTIDAITALEALNGTVISPAKTVTKTAAHVGINGDKTPASTKRVISPEGRQRMAEAQQKRYAKAKSAVKAAAKAAAVAPVATTTGKEATKKAAPKSAKGGLTAAGRKRLSEATKARWAAKKAAAATT